MKTYIFKIETSFGLYCKPIDKHIIGCCANTSSEAYETIVKQIPGTIVESKLIAFCDNYTVKYGEDNYVLEENEIVSFK